MVSQYGDGYCATRGTRTERMQRKLALRICSAYRTVSLEAIQVLAGVIPLDPMADERAEIHHEALADRDEIRKQTIQRWQERWDTLQGKAEWTRRLIPTIGKWTNRQHGELNYWVTQFLTGHGCFRAYLHRFGRLEDGTCVYCAAPADTAEHTVFECPRWEARRTMLQIRIEQRIGPDYVVKCMLVDPNNWDSITSFIAEIMRDKETEERQRQQQIWCNNWKLTLAPKKCLAAVPVHW